MGSSLNIHCTDASVSVTLIKEGGVRLCLYLYKSSKSEDLSLDKTVTVSRQKFAIYRKNSAAKLASGSTLMMCLAVFCKIMCFLSLL